MDLLEDGSIGRVRGAKDDPYTDGVICEKVARYAERVHHKDRLLYPLRRIGAKGSGQWQRIGWDEALDEIASRFRQAEEEAGPEAVWPYYYAGTMGHVHRDGLNRLRHARGYSDQYDTICTGLAWPGYVAGTGLLGGVDPVEMADSDVVVIWGTNAVATQVNVMTHAMRARRRNGAKIVAVDVYENATMQQADMQMLLRPGTDAALALAAMHVMLREGLADRDYMARFTDFSPEFEAHVMTRSPEWAAPITGLSVEAIEAFARLVASPRTYFRLGYGFTRQRNGSFAMHAALCLPAMSGAWQHRGGGALHSNSGTWQLDKSRLTGQHLGKSGRSLDMSQIGAVLAGDEKALKGGPPVKAMIVQNTNPASVAPDQTATRKGLARDDLFLVVHEQFMTETAELADIVLPATMFLEHNDYYTRGGHTRVLLGPKLAEAPGEARSNHEVINAIALRLGLEDEGFRASDQAIVADTLTRSGYGDFDEIAARGYVERARPERDAHFAGGFGWPDGRFRFAPDWPGAAAKMGLIWACDPASLPHFADHYDIIDQLTDAQPFKLVTSPARGFLNSTFNETPGSLRREGEPSVFMHPDDMVELGIEQEDHVEIGNGRGVVTLLVRPMRGMQRKVLVAEGLQPNRAHRGGQGINVLTSAEPAPPFGGVPFHDTAVWVRPIAKRQAAE
ncbi:dimethyl sulfoxide reductase subunit A [Devosia pacifica]|uniref:Dimethyl sulfoxide reductase subunit A n=1 Tax=Devosia pacifica TaxID=1335967 RepID=A0A918VYE2_9HYPH|nr:dimethyl sulfoxide reductase subunit A [Devosia pacifica]